MNNLDLPPAVEKFLDAHPKHRAHIRYIPEMGEVGITTETVEAFTRWCVDNGLTTADKARSTREMMRMVVAALKPGSNSQTINTALPAYRVRGWRTATAVGWIQCICVH